MQENNFEKQVREKLDELHLAPSAPVWERVEATLKKKKERRLVFWLLPVLLIATGAALWQATAWHTEKEAPRTIAKAKPQPAPTFSNPHVTTQHSTTNGNSQQPKHHTPAKLFQERGQRNNIKRVELSTKTVVRTKPSSSEEAKHVAFNKRHTTKGTNRSAVISGTIAERKEADAAPLAAEHAGTSATIPAANSNAIAIQQDSIKPFALAKTGSLKTEAVPAAKKRENNKQWQWQVVGRMGVSNIMPPLASGSMLKSLQQDEPVPNYSGNNSWYTLAMRVPLSTQAAYQQPAAPKRGPQFTIGAQATRNLGKASFVITGLQYSFYSSYQDVGSAVVTPLTAGSNVGVQANAIYYNDAAQYRFLNQLHVLEVPLGFEYRLFRSLPLQIQHGISVSEVLSSRVLQYDGGTNTFHQNSANLRKTGFAFFTSIDYTIVKAKGFSLQAGPQVHYGLNRLYKTGAARHLAAGGLAIYMGF